jgi:hypothetical protein
MATRDRNDDLARHFGENLRRGRRLARMSQEEPACRAALHRTEVSFSELPRSEIQRFVDELLATGLAPSTVRNTINPLQAIPARGAP